MEFKDIGNPTYIALETFRKSGAGVVTPVWVVAENGKLYVWTVDNSGKVKRIRNNPRVRIAVSDAKGAPKSEWVEAQAQVLAIRRMMRSNASACPPSTDCSFRCST